MSISKTISIGFILVATGVGRWCSVSTRVLATVATMELSKLFLCGHTAKRPPSLAHMQTLLHFLLTRPAMCSRFCI